MTTRFRLIKPVNLNPASGFSNVLHLLLLLLLPLSMFVLVRASFVQVALALVLLSKWRMLAVQPRFWPVNIRANAIDIIVGVSSLVFMTQAESFIWMFIWAAAYAVWLIYIKPLTSTGGIALQAGLGQLAGLTALFMYWADGPTAGLVIVTGLIAYLAARHYFDAFDEPLARLLSACWAYFAAALMWVLSHWLLFYGFVAQPTLLLSVLGYGVGVLYYLDHHERLSHLLRRQVIAVMAVVVAVVLIFSDWSSKVV